MPNTTESKRSWKTQGIRQYGSDPNVWTDGAVYPSFLPAFRELALLSMLSRNPPFFRIISQYGTVIHEDDIHRWEIEFDCKHSPNVQS